MYGKATLDIPAAEGIGRSTWSGLSDAMALQFGRSAARTLSEQDGFVIVTLASGSVRVIGNDTLLGRLTIGRLHPNYKPPYYRTKG